eukprot:Nitzschia sp. Nitz4//scaffold269_size25945//2613//2921//NITZ4_008285-RA/size25945-processed-gene-0.23-mRNA-1//-1//CDS//3329544955//6037//frame0
MSQQQQNKAEDSDSSDSDESVAARTEDCPFRERLLMNKGQPIVLDDTDKKFLNDNGFTMNSVHTACLLEDDRLRLESFDKHTAVYIHGAAHFCRIALYGSKM